MLNKLFIVFLFFVLHNLSAQKSYDFDYVAEYKFYSNELGSAHDDTHYKRYDFINSKDNSYILVVYVQDKIINMHLVFDSGKSYYGEIGYDDFFVTKIGLKCPKSILKSNSSYGNLKEYQFARLRDTVINSSNYSQFSIQKIAKKKDKNSTVYIDNYIIDNTAGFSYPVLYPTDILYRKWKKGDNFPNGILKEVYGINEENKRTIYAELVKCTATEKHISFDYSGCKN